MKLCDIVCFDALIPRLESQNRNGVIGELVKALANAGVLSMDPDEVIKAVIAREDEASTGIGKGVAVPHVKLPGITEVMGAVGCCGHGVDFSSLDKEPVYTVMLLLSPANNPDKHLQAMECIFKNLNKDDFRRFLRQAQTVEVIKETLKDADEDAAS